MALGQHTVTHNVEDAAGNVTTIQTTFTVSVTPTSLGALAEQLLGATNSILTDAPATHMNRAAPTRLSSSPRCVRSRVSSRPNPERPSPPPGASWGYYPNRPQLFGDRGNDIHAAMANGDFVLYTFTGTGVAYVSEKSDGYGPIDVYLDGVLQQTVDADATGVHNQGGQTLVQVSNLPAGRHSIDLIKKSGVYMLVDSFTVQP